MTSTLDALAGLRTLARADVTLLRRHRKLALSAIGILFIPALYALIYLSALWDPASRTQALAVAVVNLDRGVTVGDRRVALGADLVTQLTVKPRFDYRAMNDAEAARRAVREGRLQFALLIPADFSEQAVPGAQAGAARVVIYTSEGNNWTAANFARRFAPELGQRVNDALNEQRWALVLDSAAGSRRDLQTLRDGLHQVQRGAADLVEGGQRLHEGTRALHAGLRAAAGGGQAVNAGAQQLADGVPRLTDGLRQTGQTLRTMEARLPPDAELRQLKAAGHRLALGTAELALGLEPLVDGADRLRAGAAQLRQDGGSLLLVGDRIAAAGGQLEDGAGQLRQGLQQARDGVHRLAEGAARLDATLAPLTDGLQRMGGGLRQMTAALPADAELAQAAQGARELAQGAGRLDGALLKLRDGAGAAQAGSQALTEGAVRLASGVQLLVDLLPAEAGPGLSGSAEGLAHSVEPVVEVTAPVANYGVAFTPNFVPLALWMGATLTSFLFAFTRLPDSALAAPPLARALGKLAIPALLVLGQSVLMLAMLEWVLQVRVPSLPRFALTLAIASLSSLAILFALVRALGEVGKVVALLLMIVQLSASGGTLPPELMSPLFRALHPLLPFTWLVRAMRTSMFGAYDGAWASAWALVIGAAVVALAVGAYVGRWRVVPAEKYRPALEL
jgi:putative membrane protein